MYHCNWDGCNYGPPTETEMSSMLGDRDKTKTPKVPRAKFEKDKCLEKKTGIVMVNWEYSDHHFPSMINDTWTEVFGQGL